MVRTVIAVCVAAFLCAGASAAVPTDAPTVQEVTIPGAGGVQLACDLTLPAGTAPDGGWPGIVVFPSFGLSHTYEEGFDQMPFADTGFASVSCDERGTGSSTGSFDLAGPSDAQDAQAIFDWLAVQTSVSPTQIGAYGWDLGGAEVWNAAVHGVPFKAIVPAYTWSSLRRGLRPTGAVNQVALSVITAQGPPTWNTPSGIAARSYRGHLGSLAIPTLIVHNRENDEWDLSQATAAYRLLAGPKRLLVTRSSPVQSAQVVAWFWRYLADGDRVGGGVEIEHATDQGTTKFGRVPPTRSVTVNLPGTALKRSVWLTGGPLETFGGGSVTIRYSGASWQQVVATVSAASGKVVTKGAVPVTRSEGLLKIPLLNEAMLLPRGKKLTVTLSSHDAEFGGTATGTIAVQRVTLRLSVLARAVSH